MPRKLNLAAVLAACGIVIIGLSLLAFLGLYNRYWSDDWCYNLDFKQLGAIGAARTYFFTGDAARRGYSTDRYSLTLLGGLFYLPGIFGTRILAGLIIILWIVGLLWVVSSAGRHFEAWPRGVSLLAVTFLLYYALYLAPQRFQILYWRAGVHYSFTIVLGLYVLGLITSRGIGKLSSRLVNVAIVPLAFFAGGLSETGCAYLVTAAIIMLAGAWVGKRKKFEWARRALVPALIALISLLAAMVVLILSPSNSRYDTMAVRSTSLPLVPFISFQFAFNFIADSLLTLPAPHFVFVVLFGSLSIISSALSQKRQAIPFRQTVGLILGVGIIAFVLIAAVQAPSIRFYSAPPEPRAQSLSRFTMLVALACISWVIGQAAFARWQMNWFVSLATVSIVICTLYTARLILQNYEELPGWAARAQQWDQRDLNIRRATAQGVRRLIIPVIDTHDIGVQDIMRSKSMTGQWVSTCGSAYYGLDAIRSSGP